ncbi:hypothetical protein FB192DRAFT_1362196 [Mucor lusitanicus]|uniref:Nudix hydrolase domain-containing protein n=2 Tax=Mucor circinelloides f. lusitanicus TaxID=29924 RepID=A0A168MEH6_MUCCL|nr:hypothetical protein FB192DRAFT_1362196 [Mucor lusitanicus]OAD04808.1 hypothetical protein MUCCIDRAFT_108639 [Mucor lusitanicus CBS 277.49]
MSLSINTKGTAAKVVSEEIQHKRYITVWNRTTEFDDGRVIQWDVVGHSTPEPTFCVVFTFDTKTKTTCILKEFAQGTNEIKYTCVAGSYDRRKHASITQAAQHELSEEALLTGGQWINLLPSDYNEDGVSELKWGKNRFIPFLCLDPIKDENPMARDAEEYMEVVHDVTIKDLKTFITRAEMMLPSVQTCWMALSYLEEHELL